MCSEGKSHMTLSQYWEVCAMPVRYGTGNEQRHGQWAFNVLAFERPDLSEQIRSGPLDPFYSDAVLPEFYKWVEENWNG